ncbi:MAG: hypothetical protein AAGB00_04995 [Planctomycetota bacterium]
MAVLAVLIFSGFGLVVPVGLFAVMFCTQLVVDGAFGEGYYVKHAWPKSLGCSVAALLVWYFGSWLNGHKARVLVDQETNEEVVIRPDHSFFFIPVRCWSLIILAAAVLAAVSGEFAG